MDFRRIKYLIPLILVGGLFTHCNEKQELQTELEFGGGALSGTTVEQQNVSKVAFRNSVYNLTRNYCVSCHTSQYPQHAASNYEDAHDVLLESNKVDLAFPELSSIYTKISGQSHGCWTPNCTDDAAEMLAAIQEWKAAIDAARAENPDAVDIPGGNQQEECVPQTVTIQGATSEQAFEGTLYALTRQRCSSCHDNRFPNHSSPNSQLAHDTLINNTHPATGQRYADLANPANSRLISKIQGGHQGIAASVATDIQNAITDWNNGISAARTVTTCRAGNGVVESTQPLVDSNQAVTNTVFELQANQAVLSNGFTLNGDYVADTSGGGNINTAPNVGDNRGRAVWSINVEVPGRYEILGEVQGQDNGSDSFWVSIDEQDYAEWHVPAEADYVTTRVLNGNPGNVTPLAVSWQLGAGQHNVIFARREANTRVRRVIVRPVGSSEEGGAAPTTLSFDLSQVTGRAGVTLEINVKILDEFAYELTSVRMKGGAGLYVKGLKIYINGRNNPEYSTFNLIERTIGTNDEIISPFSMIMLKEFGEESDKFGIKFDVIQ